MDSDEFEDTRTGSRVKMDWDWQIQVEDKDTWKDLRQGVEL